MDANNPPKNRLRVGKNSNVSKIKGMTVCAFSSYIPKLLLPFMVSLSRSDLLGCKSVNSPALLLLSLICVLSLGPVPAAWAADPPDLVVADFEGDSYGAWEVTGEAFGSAPAQGTLPGQQQVTGFQGRGLVNTFRKGDRSTGTLTSPPFTIERPYLRFLIGGGKNEVKTALVLEVDGQVVRTATGPNAPNAPGGTERLETDYWDVRDLAGRQAVLRIVDQATGGWGHLNVDQIVQTAQRPVRVAPASREIPVTAKFLAIPIRNGAPKRLVTLQAGGRTIVRNTMELAEGEPDWWAMMDVEAWQGQTVTLQVDQLPEDSKALAAIEPTDKFRGPDPLYREPLRAQFHFSARRGFHNDPNGCVFYQGEYHLFFQHNPYAMAIGNQHWGHAVSRDLVHWEERSHALLPDERGLMYSGSAVVDTKNTSGFGREGQPPLVIVHTVAGNPTVQSLAWSTDGRTFTKESGRPVLPQITPGNRDPKVFWHEPTGKWVMALYVQRPRAGEEKADPQKPLEQRHTIEFFTSPNLKDWTPASVHEATQPGPAPSWYLYECPDFFELAVDGDPARKKWVLLGANTEYAVGRFDGTTFTPEAERLRGQQGPPNVIYAGQSFNDMPDGRRVFICWWLTPTPGMPFSQSMTLPMELGLTETAAGPRLTFRPVRELEALRKKTHTLGPLALAPGDKNPLAALDAELVEIRAELEPAGAAEIVLRVRGGTVAYDARKQELVVNGYRAPAPLKNGKVKMTVFCDRTGIEVFAADGLTYLPFAFEPRTEDRSLSLTALGGTANISSLEVHELQSIWEKR